MAITNYSPRELMLSVSEKRGTQYVYAKQGDALSRNLSITLVDDDSALTFDSGERAAIRVLKPDGTSLAENATIGNDSIISVELSDQILAVSGLIYADIVIYSGSTIILSSEVFTIEAEAAPVGLNAVSENDVTFINSLVSEGLDVIAEFTTKIAQLDNLVAAAGDASQNSEIVDARVDKDGTTHTTVGQNLRYTQDNWLKIAVAYDKQVSDIVAGQLHIDEAIHYKTLYRVCNSTGANIGWMICATVNANFYTKTQIRALYSGELSYRTKDFSTDGSTWSSWVKFETEANKVTSLSSSSSNIQYPTAKAVYDALLLKINKEDGKGLSTNDYTTTEKNKLAGIEEQANKTTVDTDLSSSSENPVQNKVVTNKLASKADKDDTPTYEEIFDKKNLLALPNTEEEGISNNGVTLKIKNNRITVNGTATGGIAQLNVDLEKSILLEAGEKYTISIQKTIGTFNGFVFFFTKVNGSYTSLFQINCANYDRKTVNCDTVKSIDRVTFGVSNGTNAESSFNLQLERGELVTDYVPPIGTIKSDLIPSGFESNEYKAQSIDSQSQTSDRECYPSIYAVRTYVNNADIELKNYVDEELNGVAAEIDKVFESQAEVATYLNSPQAKAGQTVKVKDAITGDYINYVIQETNGNFTITALEDLLFNTQIIDPVNLLSVSGNEKTLYGVTATIDNQTISLSGTATQAMNLNVRIPTVSLRSGTYTLKRFLYEGAADFSVSLTVGEQTPTTINYTNIITISKGVTDYKTVNLENDIDINYISFYISAGTELEASLKLHLQEGDAVPYSWGNPNKEKEYTFKEKLIPHHMNYIYVSNEYNLTTEGFGKTCFDSIIAANDSITDNSKDKPYTIVVKSGTYNEFEERYSGSEDTSSLQGIVTKDYVYYESETPDNPSACILTWDGSVGYNTGELTNDLAAKKSIFHITNGRKGMHTHIKGFTIISKNTRYGIHMESGGYGRNEEWLVENCIIEYGGRPDVENGLIMPVIGIGMSPHENGILRNVKAFFSESFSARGLRTLNVHDNYESSVYTNTPAVKAGARLIIENCNFCGKIARFATVYNSVKGAISETLFVADIINSVNISSIDSTAWRVNLLNSVPTEFYTKTEVDSLIENLRNEFSNS